MTFSIYPETVPTTGFPLDSTAITNKEVLLGQYYFNTNGTPTYGDYRNGLAVVPNTDVKIIFN